MRIVYREFPEFSQEFKASGSMNCFLFPSHNRLPEHFSIHFNRMSPGQFFFLRIKAKAEQPADRQVILFQITAKPFLVFCCGSIFYNLLRAGKADVRLQGLKKRYGQAQTSACPGIHQHDLYILPLPGYNRSHSDRRQQRHISHFP